MNQERLDAVIAILQHKDLLLDWRIGHRITYQGTPDRWQRYRDLPATSTQLSRFDRTRSQA